MMQSNDNQGIKVPSRIVPVPTSISPEAQAFLANSAMIPDMSPPGPDDLAGWKAHVELANAGVIQLSERPAREHPAAIEEHSLGACSLYEVKPSTFSDRHAQKALFYVHGGGFTVGSGIAAAYAAHTIAGVTGLRTYSVDYRMPPDHPFPEGLEDSVEAYRYILERHKPSDIAVHGASAGGGLAASFLLKARDIGLPLPAACVLMTPEADLTESGDTFETNYLLDVVMKQPLTSSILLYASGHDLRDPYLSPLFGDFSKGFPPTLLTSGTRDTFLSNTVRFHRALRQAGIEAELHVWEAMPHGGFFGAPEDVESYGEQGRFIKRHLAID